MIDGGNEQRIRELAFQLWEQDGHLDGQSDRHWEMARSIIAREDAERREIEGEPPGDSAERDEARPDRADLEDDETFVPSSKTAYFVTFGERGPAALEAEGKPLELAAAISLAFQLLDDDMADVAIRDAKGNSISGEDLRACWRGDKEVSRDLKAV
jgi:Protein of unknown function (DUF2934)